MSEPSKQDPGLFKVMVFATALSFGIMGALMVSMKGFFGGNVSFQFSLKTVLAFAGGCFAGWLFWRVVRHLMGRVQ